MSKKNNKKQKDRKLFHITIGDERFVPSTNDIKRMTELFNKALNANEFILTDYRVQVTRII